MLVKRYFKWIKYFSRPQNFKNISLVNAPVVTVSRARVPVGTTSEYYQSTTAYPQYQAAPAYNNAQWAVRYGPSGIISEYSTLHTALYSIYIYIEQYILCMPITTADTLVRVSVSQSLGWV